MIATPNGFKRALLAGRAQMGLWLALADAYGAEICATSGFDWLLIDGEHAPNDLRTTLAQLQALAPYPVHAIVRPVEGNAAGIKQLLDIGAQTLLVPMVESGEQAAALVAATRYPPAGVRGVGSGIARASRWQAIPEYFARASDEICLLLQIESQSGFANIDAIASTAGVDGIFLGPADLAASLGLGANPAHPEVVAAIDGAIAVIRSHEKAAGTLTYDETLARHYLATGATFVAVGADVSILASATRALAKRFNAAEPT